MAIPEAPTYRRPGSGSTTDTTKVVAPAVAKPFNPDMPTAPTAPAAASVPTNPNGAQWVPNLAAPSAPANPTAPISATPPAAPGAPVQPLKPTPAPQPAFVADAVAKAKAKAEEKFAAMTAPAGSVPPGTTAPGSTGTPAAVPAETSGRVAPAPATGAAGTDANGQVTGTPDAAAAAPVDPFQPLVDAALEAANATEDPLAKAKFNQAMLDIGLKNQGALDAAKMAINADPRLRGMPGGSALLDIISAKAGMSSDQVLQNLSIESLQRLQDYNKWGFEQAQQIITQRENWKKGVRDDLLAAGDIDSYADAFERDTGIPIDRTALKAESPTTIKLIETLSVGIDNNIKEGTEASMARARTLFDQLKAVSPEIYGTMQFEDWIGNKEAWTQQNTQNATIRTQIRDAIANGDTALAINGLQTLYPEDEAETKGRDLLTGGMTLEEVNRLLGVAGYDLVASLDDMIGLEDELYIASELDKLVTKHDAADWMSQAVADIKKDLAANMGIEVLTPEMEQAIRSWLMTAKYTGGITLDANGNYQLNESALTPPWLDESGPNSILFESWPLPGQTGFSDDFPDETTPELYARNQALDAAWLAYLESTPEGSRLSRKDWYTKAVELAGGDTFTDGTGGGETPTASTPVDLTKPVTDEPNWQSKYQTNDPALATARREQGFTETARTFNEETGRFEEAAPVVPVVVVPDVTKTPLIIKDPKSDADYINNAINSGNLSSLSNDLWAKLILGGTGYENAYQKLLDKGLVTRYAAKPVNIKNYKTKPGTHNIQNYKAAYSDLKVGSFVEVNGIPYRVEEVGVTKSAGREGVAGDFSRENRAYTRVTNMKTGEVEYILPSSKWDA